MKRVAAGIVAVMGMAALAACQPGGAEKAGERADSAYEESTTGQKDLTDGPMENAGEAVDKAAADAKEGAADAGAAMQRKADEVSNAMKKDEPKK